MTLANLASEMGAKNAVFPPDEVLDKYYGSKQKGVWADENASYARIIEINMDEVFPVVAIPHNVDNIRSVYEVEGTVVQEGLIGTCTNGRIEDLRIASNVLRGKHIKKGFQLNIIPASRQVYLQAVREGLITPLVEAGANILSPSCGPCLGTGQGIPANGHNVISTANRNFHGRMGNTKAAIFLASPEVVAASSLTGYITNPTNDFNKKKFPFEVRQSKNTGIEKGENRRFGNVWDYSDIDNLNTDQMFAGKHTYSVQSSDPEAVMNHLFEDFDPQFRPSVKKDDIILAGENFGCGSSREHPAVGLAYAGVEAVIAKSVNRIFYRSSLNQGLALIVHKEAVESYKRGDEVRIDFVNGTIKIGDHLFTIPPMPEKLRKIIEMKGLVNYIKAL
jgi:3-isopropylmalate dehydratase small subunit